MKKQNLKWRFYCECDSNLQEYTVFGKSRKAREYIEGYLIGLVESGCYNDVKILKREPVTTVCAAEIRQVLHNNLYPDSAELIYQLLVDIGWDDNLNES